MTLTNRLISLATILGLIILSALFITQKSYGSSPSGLPSTIASSTSSFAVGTSQGLLFATSTCAARIVSTREAGVMLTFNEPVGQVPTAITGHFQAASTTVAYDSGQFGCGAVRAISATGAATTITVSETR